MIDEKVFVECSLEELVSDWSKDPLMLLELQNFYFIKQISPYPMKAYRVGKPPNTNYFWQTDLRVLKK